MNIIQFFSRIQGRLEEEYQTLFTFFQNNFFQRMKGVSNPSDWKEKQLSVEEAINLYQFVCQVLWQLAIQLADSTDDSVYSEATQIATTAREVLGIEYGDDQFPPTQIMSPTNIMVQEGLLKRIPNPDDPEGEDIVQPTEAGEQVAEEMERLIREHHG